jgi:cell division protein FtsB
MTDPLNMPVMAMTRNGTEKTTIAKAIDDLADQQAIKRAARRCQSCGKFKQHEQLKTVPTDDGGTQRMCADCLDDDPAAKQLYQQQWAEAGEIIDEALAKASLSFPMDSLAKAQASDRLARFDAIGNFGRMVADYRRRWAIEDRVVRVVKAERTRKETDRIQKKTAKIRRKIEATELRKAEAERGLAALIAEQAQIAAQINDLAKRTDAVFARASSAYGAVAKQRDIQAIADLAKQDQERAGWRDKAFLTTDPDLRAAYLARANGEEIDDD